MRYANAMSNPRPRYAAGNLTEDAWAALRRLKFEYTSPDIQPTLSAVVLALVAQAENDPVGFVDKLTETT